jgi:choline-sulfatase
MPSDRPNIIFCHVDQLHHGALSLLGCKDVATPNIDRIYQDGMSFERAQASYPLCSPSRACWYTGRMASEHSIIFNGFDVLPTLPDLGQWMGARGYDCFFGGKWHVIGRDVRKSFKVIYPEYGIGERSDDDLAQSVESFLRDRQGDQPFFLNVGFLNPHDCCHLNLVRYHLATKLGVESHLELPPLPPDYDPNKPLLPPFSEHWTPQQAALYIHYYYRMAERVDAAVGRVYDAVQALPDAENTVFIFASDHGEMLTHRNQLFKVWLYEPSLRVPLAVVQPGKIKAGAQNNEHVIGGVDITATILDYAGADPMPDMTFARSFRPLLEGTAADWHDYVPAESRYDGMRQSFRAGRDGKYKSIYALADGSMELYDTDADPYEQKNLADDAQFSSVRQEHDAYRKDFESKIVPCKMYQAQLAAGARDGTPKSLRKGMGGSEPDAGAAGV